MFCTNKYSWQGVAAGCSGGEAAVQRPRRPNSVLDKSSVAFNNRSRIILECQKQRNQKIWRSLANRFPSSSPPGKSRNPCIDVAILTFSFYNAAWNPCMARGLAFQTLSKHACLSRWAAQKLVEMQIAIMLFCDHSVAHLSLFFLSGSFWCRPAICIGRSETAG